MLRISGMNSRLASSSSSSARVASGRSVSCSIQASSWPSAADQRNARFGGGDGKGAYRHHALMNFAIRRW